MNATTLSELKSLTEEARALEEGARRLAERAERLIQMIEQEAEQSGDAAALKRSDGRLTEAGVAAVNAAFESGATVTEVAKQFDIHVSAASNRRTIWLAKRAVEPSAKALKAMDAFAHPRALEALKNPKA